eukprot:jgi/Tetstr1/447962/TSEL_035267.t1
MVFNPLQRGAAKSSANAVRPSAWYAVFAAVAVATILPHLSPSGPASGSDSSGGGESSGSPADLLPDADSPVSGTNRPSTEQQQGPATAAKSSRANKRVPLDHDHVKRHVAYVKTFKPDDYGHLLDEPSPGDVLPPFATMSADQLRDHATALEGQLASQRKQATELLTYCKSFQTVADARGRTINHLYTDKARQKTAASKMESKLAAAELRAVESGVATELLQGRVDELEAEVAAANATVADQREKLEQLQHLEALNPLKDTIDEMRSEVAGKRILSNQVLVAKNYQKLVALLAMIYGAPQQACPAGGAPAWSVNLQLVFTHLLTDHPELQPCRDILTKEEKKAVEKETLDEIWEHWQDISLDIYLHCKLTNERYRWLINLLSKKTIGPNGKRERFPLKHGPCTIHNTLLCGFYLRDDKVKYIKEFMPNFISQLSELQTEGITIDGEHFEIQFVGAGDYKYLRSVLGLIDGGCLTHGCCKCETKSFDYDRTRAELDAMTDHHGRCSTENRTNAEQRKLRHEPDPAGEYDCEFCKAFQVGLNQSVILSSRVKVTGAASETEVSIQPRQSKLAEKAPDSEGSGESCRPGATCDALLHS